MVIGRGLRELYFGAPINTELDKMAVEQVLTFGFAAAQHLGRSCLPSRREPSRIINEKV